MKYINGIVIKEGDNNPDLGCEEKYLPVCWKCWYEQQEYDFKYTAYEKMDDSLIRSLSFI